MAPTIKEGQNAELHRTIWRSANDLRGSVDCWDFKSYMLGMLFYRFISENLIAYINAGEYKAGDAVIQLPPDLFFGTTIATYIVVPKKSKSHNAVRFIDASAEFEHTSNKNKLTAANQQKSLDAFTDREDIEHFARLVPAGDISENAYNIAVSSYVEQEDTREIVDITALNVEIARIFARQSELRAAINAIVVDLEGVKS